ncbi:hypothetical protein PEPS_13210 [Persicobacter psychrovividus]|uniref:Response regulatory domain-containing protein n=2 Tax=Persicobacter psychrovividus TaxID=387638 RepID=A0ABM7VED7_9BACT|nr:hypothetical protein PEPS_13210 [Persicobacter psychrovividus]
MVNMGGMRVASFSTKETLHRWLADLKAEAKRRRVKLKAWLDTDIPAVLVGDKRRLYVLVHVLLSELLENTEEQAIELELRLESKNDDQLVLLFEVRSGWGTKLGCKAAMSGKLLPLVEELGGKLQLEAAPGDIQLQLSVPLLEGKEEEQSAHSQKQKPKSLADFEGRSVLLVEDDPVNVFVFKKWLLRWNLKVEVAQNGLEAWRKVNEQPFDIVLLDLHLPIMDGWAFMERLRACDQEYFKQLPVIAITAFINWEDGIKPVAGVKAMVVKPIMPNELVLYLKKYINRESVPFDFTQLTIPSVSSAEEKGMPPHEFLTVDLKLNRFLYQYQKACDHDDLAGRIEAVDNVRTLLLNLKADVLMGVLTEHVGGSIIDHMDKVRREVRALLSRLQPTSTVNAMAPQNRKEQPRQIN